MSNHPLTDGMNPQQAQAITAGDGPVLVLAGPGSGKTSVLTRRIAYLISEKRVPAHRMMAVTFTNKAAGEMRERVERLLDDKLRGLQIGTFHATCARYLRMEAETLKYRRDYTIYDTDDTKSLIKEVMSVLGLDTEDFNPYIAQRIISNSKNDMILPHMFQVSDYRDEVMKRIYDEYQKRLRKYNAMDFDDLLLNMVILLNTNREVRERYQERFHYVLVDEFQDTNKVQYELVKYFAAPQNNVFVVGDEDQAIYAFRGADYRNVLRFRDSYPDPTVILLEQNYRSTQTILDVARAVIDHNSNRTPKALHTDKGQGERVTLYEAHDERDEAQYIHGIIYRLRMTKGYDYRDFAVMYRTNAQSRALEQSFVRASIPFRIIGGVGFYKRREVKDILAYLRVVQNPDDAISFDRIINEPKRQIGKKSLQSFKDWVNHDNLTYSEALLKLVNGDKIPLSPSVSKKFKSFAELLFKWQRLSDEGNLLYLIDRIIFDTEYYSHLNKISSNEFEEADRIDNISELRGLLQIATEDETSLEEFLADQSLVSDVDELKEDKDAVTLLTLHASKGLEYPIVFITGMEKGMLPHSRALEKDNINESLSEERRLFYVGVTRAKERLFLTYAFTRALYGGTGTLTTVSPFLSYIPIDLLDGSPIILHTLESLQLGIQKSSEYAQSFSQKNQPKESRLQRDLRKNDVIRSNGDSKLSDKIVPFPGRTQREKPASKFKFGQRVYHPVFGEGKVIGVTRDMIDVMFESEKLPKKILADTEGFKLLD